MPLLKKVFTAVAVLTFIANQIASAQIDPNQRNLLQLGYDQSATGDGPQALYAYYYLNDPAFLRTNVALRLAVAPAYLDAELGFRQLLSPSTDLGVGVSGGAFSDNFYEVRQGHYLKGESFDGHGGGASLSLYQLLNPRQKIPLNVVGRVGLDYSTYSDTKRTESNFILPDDRGTAFARAGLRFAGKEPLLYPDLAMEVSIWFERQWRLEDGLYGFAGDRGVNRKVDVYWLYAGLNYAWTNVGHQFSLAVTAGGTDDADRFSAWRLGGVLPLVAEFPLILPGYYHQELTATRFVHLNASYLIPLDKSLRWQLRLEAASACLDYLTGFEQPSKWQTGVGTGLTFTPWNRRCRIVLRYGYGITAIRDGKEGAHSTGFLFQYDFEKHKQDRRTAAQ